MAAVLPGFDSAAFLADALSGCNTLDLMARGRHLAHALQRHLPADFDAAVEVLVNGVAQPLGYFELLAG